MSVAKQPITLRWNHWLMLYCMFHAPSSDSNAQGQISCQLYQKRSRVWMRFFSPLGYNGYYLKTETIPTTTKKTNNKIPSKTEAQKSFSSMLSTLLVLFTGFLIQLTIVMINQTVLDGLASYIACKSHVLLACAQFCFSRAWSKQNSGKKGICFPRKRGVGETWHWVLTVLSYCRYEMRQMVLYYSLFYHCCCIYVCNKVCCNAV